MSRPVVGVVVPVYNGEQHLRAALDSVFAQTWRPLDVVVIDDGSTDGAAAIALADPRVRYLRQENKGVAASRNAGAAATVAEYLAFLDQDDLWLPGKIEAQMELLADDPEAGFALTLQRRFVDAPTIPAWVRPEWLDRDLPGYEPSALLVRRSVFEAVGPFDPRFVQASDSEWFFRASAMGCRAAVVQQALTLRRLHSANNSRHVARTAADLRRAAFEAIQRRRSENA